MSIRRAASCMCLYSVLALSQIEKGAESVQPARRANGVLEMTVTSLSALAPSGSRSPAPAAGLLRITLKNLTNDPIRLVDTAPECQYATEVRDSSGGACQDD